MKSHVSEVLEVMRQIYIDACCKCSAEVSFRDLKTIRSRVNKQGLSFLTITLPTFCADFERSLSQGVVDPTAFRYFRKAGAIPAFMQDMLGRIFDQETGRIIDEFVNSPPATSSDLIISIRQVCLAFKKIKLVCTPKRVSDALESFIEIERSFSMFPLPDEDQKAFALVSSVLWDNIMGVLRLDMLVPRHGPGQTAEHITGNRKYVWRFWHERLEPYFPLIDTGFSASCWDPLHQSEELERVSFVHSGEEPPARVTTVPKTLKGPRIIAIEPCCNQYTQQAIARSLMDLIERSPMTAGHINFRDQSVNQRLALISSNDGRLATIDLSEASDRIPVGYALQMFRSNPPIREAIEACRSREANIPMLRQTVKLRKFASMGSALCFPVESMYFYTLCVIGLLRSKGLPVSHGNCFAVSRDVYVYGDDILVPTAHADSVFETLAKYNCKVNSRKTFYSGKFRESCGVDAYDGVQVTPAYINTLPPKDRQQSKELISWVAVANNFQRRGYLRTAQLIFKKVEDILGKLPWIEITSQAIGRNHSWPSSPPKRWNRRYQRVEILCWVPVPIYRTDRLEGYGALMKCLLKLESLKDLSVSRDAKHLERTALHGEVALKRRWVPELNTL